MELNKTLQDMNEKHEKEKKMTSMLCMLLKVSRHDVTANEQWQQKLNEQYHFYPPPPDCRMRLQILSSPWRIHQRQIAQVSSRHSSFAISQ